MTTYHWDPVATDLAGAMVEAHHALGQEKYDALVQILNACAERNDNGEFTFESIIGITNSLNAVTVLANLASRP